MVETAINSIVYNMDCMQGMKQYPDKYFDLAVVDPPYGIDNKLYRSSYGKFIGGLTKYSDKRWDKKAPEKYYFNELIRVSKNQVIWGGNYFGLPAHRTYIVWDKMTFIPTMSQVEMAWTSFDSPARYVRINSNDSNRIHPTQKPVALYDWIFKNYAKPTDKILDTHLGSGSSRIAAYKAKLDFTGYELDTDYYEASEKRFQDYIKQERLF